MSICITRRTVVLSGYSTALTTADAVCRVVYGLPSLQATVGKPHAVTYDRYGDRKLLVECPKRWIDDARNATVVHGGNGLDRSKATDLIASMLKHLAAVKGVETELRWV